MFAHVCLRKENVSSESAEYAVESFDFNADQCWGKIGLLALKPKTNEYRFTPSDAWADKKIVPPELYGLNDAEQQQHLASSYKGYALRCMDDENPFLR
jgi:hypothetical protein